MFSEDEEVNFGGQRNEGGLLCVCSELVIVPSVRQIRSGDTLDG